MAPTESVADFELLAAGPGGVIAAGRPAGGVTDGVLGRRRRSDAAHEEQRGQGQRRATGRHCSNQDLGSIDRSIEQIKRNETSKLGDQCNAGDRSEVQSGSQATGPLYPWHCSGDRLYVAAAGSWWGGFRWRWLGAGRTSRNR